MVAAPPNRITALRRAALCGLLLAAFAACTPPIRQFDLKDQPLTCEQANAYSLRTLQAMGFTITQLDPATAERRGMLRGTREEVGTDKVTVVVACDGRTAAINASEDGKWLGQLEFKRGFYLSFTATATQAAITEAAARDEARRPPEARTHKGLQVRIEPVRGLGAKLDFGLDLAAGGVLPVRVVVDNGTPRTYGFDPADLALIREDGSRVRALAVEEAARRVAGAPQQASGGDAAAHGIEEVTQRLQAQVLQGGTVSAHQTTKGYLYFPLAHYVKGRVSLVDRESEETEGFLVEF